MYYKKKILIFTFLSFAVTSWSQLVNPSFENGLTGWERLDSSGTFSIRTTKQAGQNILYVGNEGDSRVNAAVQSFLVSSKGVRHFEVSARIKVRDVHDRFAGLFIRTWKGEQLQLLKNMGHLDIFGSSNWEIYSLPFWIDDQTTRVEVGCLLSGKGEAWFDDLGIIEIKPDSVSGEALAILRQALDTVCTHSLNREQLNFDRIGEHALSVAGGASQPEEAYPAIRYLLNELNDRHSFLITSERAAEMAAPENKKAERSMPAGKMLNGSIGYLDIPSISISNQGVLEGYADRVQRLILRLHQSGAKNWIIDLRENYGGNCWPMLAGLGPLLSQDTCGAFFDPVDETFNYWVYRDSAAYAGDKVQIKVNRFYTLPDAPRKIAVLISEETVSSGELIAIAFHEQPGVRLFGHTTRGLTTSNGSYKLLDGSIINVTNALFTNRNGKAYPRGVVPNVVNDTPLEAALHWLN